MGTTQRDESGTARRLCVVLHGPAGGTPGLLRELSKRDMHVVAVDDPHAAFARICNDARAGNTSILVFDGDHPRAMGEQLAGAMERFAPAAVCWNHLPGANPPIQPVVGPLAGAIDAAMTPMVRTEPTPAKLDPLTDPEPSREQSNGAPKLRLIEAPETPRAQSPVSAKDVLDADELDALLASELPKKN